MRKRSWGKQDLVESAKQSTSIRQLLGRLGLKAAGGNYTQVQKYITEYEVDVSHFKGRGWNKGLTGLARPHNKIEQILVQNSTYQSFKLRNRLFSGNLKEKACEECGWSKTSEDGRIPLELHHINGNGRDNRLENLMILCPNCHSLKPNHRGRNIKKQVNGQVLER